MTYGEHRAFNGKIEVRPFYATETGLAMADLQAIHRHIERHEQAHIARIQEFLRQPSISAENRGIRECALLLNSYYEALGCREAEIVETDGHPAVWAYYDAGAKRTIVNYRMYDVQPVAGEEWSSPPFEARIVKQPPFGDVILARGAFNSKGPYRAWLNALESVIAVEGTLPVNVMFVVEGEEEIGSPHLPQVIAKYADRLKTADAVLIAGAGQSRNGQVQMTLGHKGIVYFEMECSGEAWGRGPRQRDIHSSFKAVADSPAWRLVQALATMTSPDGNRVLVDGWYDRVAGPSPDDLRLVDDLVTKFDPDAWREIHKIDVFTDDARGRELILNYLYATTLNIDGIWGGYTGAGTKTVLPHRVTVKCDVRLVPNQESREIVPMIRAHLERHGYPDIQIRQLSGYEWSRTSVNQPVVQAVLSVYKKYGVEDVVIWPTSAGSSPMCLFSGPPLGLPVVRGGLGHGGRNHSPDEYLVIEGNDRVAGLVKAEKSYVDMVYAYAEWPDSGLVEEERSCGA